jgi:hypothetical protein
VRASRRAREKTSEEKRREQRHRVYNERINRCVQVNQLLRFIAGCGRGFFGHEGRVAHVDLGDRGSLWMHRETDGRRVYLNRAPLPKAFHHGGNPGATGGAPA